MGLGKTLTTLALITTALDSAAVAGSPRQTTLVVTPMPGRGLRTWAPPISANKTGSACKLGGADKEVSLSSETHNQAS